MSALGRNNHAVKIEATEEDAQLDVRTLRSGLTFEAAGDKPFTRPDNCSVVRGGKPLR